MNKKERPACGDENHLCPIIYGVSIIARKWHLPVICILEQLGPQRYGQLKRLLPGITDMMLTQTLKNLEQHGLINRVQYIEIPPRVEYSLTQEGLNLSPVLRKMADWGAEQINFCEDAEVCQNCREIPDQTASIFKLMENEPDNWNNGHAEKYNRLCTDPKYKHLSGVEKIKEYVLNAIQVLTHNDQEYTRLTYVLLMDADSPMLVGNDRQYYIYLRKLVDEGLKDHSLSSEISPEELVRLISIFQTGTIIKWRLRREEKNIEEISKIAIDWFFEKLSNVEDSVT